MYSLFIIHLLLHQGLTFLSLKTIFGLHSIFERKKSCLLEFHFTTICIINYSITWGNATNMLCYQTEDNTENDKAHFISVRHKDAELFIAINSLIKKRSKVYFYLAE